VSVHEAPRLRLERWRILVPCCLFAPFLVYIGLSRGLTGTAIVLIVGICVLGALALTNFLWLDYLLVDDRSVRRVQFLGLLRKEIPIERLTRVQSGLITPLFFSYESLRFCSPDDEIEVPIEAYGKRGIPCLLRKLMSRGVEIDDRLLREHRLK